MSDGKAFGSSSTGEQALAELRAGVENRGQETE